MVLNYLQLSVIDLFLPVERFTQCVFKSLSSLVKLVLAEAEKGLFLVNFLEADSLPESLLLEFFDHFLLLGRVLAILQEFIDEGQTDLPGLFLWTFYLLAFS